MPKIITQNIFLTAAWIETTLVSQFYTISFIYVCYNYNHIFSDVSQHATLHLKEYPIQKHGIISHEYESTKRKEGATMLINGLFKNTYSHIFATLYLCQCLKYNFKGFSKLLSTIFHKLQCTFKSVVVHPFMGLR